MNLKKVLSILLVAVMLLSVIPFTASAASEPYLTFTGTDSFSIQTNNSAKNWNGTLEYSTDANTWTTWEGTSEISSDNNVLYLRGTGNRQITGDSSSRNWVITTQGTVACSGDIRTLLDYTEPESSSMGDYCFAYLFKDCTSLTTAPELWATTLRRYCYRNMFSGCTSLTTAPDLPATLLVYACYYSMFEGCANLTTAPELPATSLAYNCYQNMFKGCTSLTTAPALPATALTRYCYYNMFNGCANLTTAPELWATTLADFCYYQMFYGCTSLTTPSELWATDLENNCYSGMFQGCTGIKLSTEKTGEYSVPYSIPKEGTAESVGNNALTDMFTGTGGTFTGTPEINKTYYMYKPIPTTGFLVGEDWYETFDEAVAAVQEGDTIVCYEDVTIPTTKEITNGVHFAIDLNDHDFESTVRMFNIRHGGIEFKGTGTVATSVANAAVAVYGSTNSADADYATFKLGENVILDVPNGYGAMIGANGTSSYGAVLDIDGTVNSKWGVYINGNVAEPADKTNAAKINISGTVTAANTEAAIYAAGYAEWTIEDGANLEGGSGIYIKSGNLTVGNATITATGAKTDYVFSNNGCGATGDAIVIDSCGYPGNVPTVTINAGTITSDNGEAVASYCKQDDPRYPTAEFPRVGDVIPATSTAVFSSDVTPLAAQGYETNYDAVKGGYAVEKVDANNGVNLTVGNDITSNYFVDYTEYKGAAKIVYTYNSVNEQENQQSTTESINVADITDSMRDSLDRFVIPVSQAPAQMAETTEIQILNADDVVLDTLEYSAKTYCDNVIAMDDEALAALPTVGSTEKAEKLKTLCHTIIAYGQAAQGVFDSYDTTKVYCTNDAVNAQIAGASNSSRPTVDQGSQIRFTSVSFACTKDARLRFYIDASAATHIPAAPYEENGHSAAVKYVVVNDVKHYFIEVSDIDAADFDQQMVVHYGDARIECSVLDYCTLALNTGNDALQTLAKTLIVYNTNAEAYFG